MSLLALVYMLYASAAHAQGYPSRAVTLIVPFSPGTSVDASAREIAQVLAKKLKQPFVVENKVGAATLIASKFVADAAPDGYTLFVNGSSSMLAAETNSATRGKNHVREMAFVSPIAYLPNVITVSGELPVRTLSEFIVYLKANPGKVAYATSGVGTSNHLQVEWFKQLTGTDMTHVPYKSNDAIFIDLVSNRVQMSIAGYPSTKPYLASGKLRNLAVTLPNRMPNLDLPPAAETVPGFAVVPWLGLSAPKGTPAAVVELLDRSIQEAIAEPDLAGRGVPPSAKKKQQRLSSA